MYWSSNIRKRFLERFPCFEKVFRLQTSMPLLGSNGALIGETISVFWDLSWLFNVFCFYGLKLFRNGSFRFPDIFQYFWNIFGTSKMFTKAAPWTFFYDQHIAKNTRKSPRIFKHIICTYLNISKIQNTHFWKAPDINSWEMIFQKIIF